jgi:hypothetical protein
MAIGRYRGMLAFIAGAPMLLSVERDAPPGSQPSLTCTPGRLHPGQILTIRMSIPHGRDLGIWDPEGRFFFVSFWQPDSSSPAQPIADWEAFAYVSELTLPVTTATAVRWNRGDQVPVRIFTTPGWYRIVLGENLETDARAGHQMCRVYSSGRSR